MPSVRLAPQEWIIGGLDRWPAAGWGGEWEALPRLAAMLATVPEAAWAALVSALVTLALVTAAMARRPHAARNRCLAAAETETATCDFLLNGSTLRPLTGAARALVEGLGGRHASLQALTRHLEKDCPTIAEDLEGLVLFGTSFRRTSHRADGSSFEVVGQPRGGAAILSIRPASPEARALDCAERALARARQSEGCLRQALDRAPILVWMLCPDETLAWANAAYCERFDVPEGDVALGRHSSAFAHLLEEVPLMARHGCERRRRVKVAAKEDRDPYWFELSEIPLASGERLCYAVEVDDLVAAEASLRRFVETLTETFAHLPIGLAVFDKNRRLGLFNPALSDLVKIDAVWLAGRPSLRDFLERLRETRQMPEQKDFAAFRRMLTTLEEGAREGTYEENWVLPSGKIFRVTGRPHPQGALAFLFEDISPAIHLERRYRGELELSQATLDRMSEAVAVFDTSGMLVFVNAAFEALWGLDPMTSLDGPSVGELAALWEARSAPTPLWDDLRAFATGADARTSWTGAALIEGGRPITVLVAPLPNGSTLVTFRDRRDHPAPPQAGEARDELGIRDAGGPWPRADDPGPAAVSGAVAAALAEVEAPAEAALVALGTAIASAPDGRVFGSLAQAAQALKDALARARAIQAAEPAAACAVPGAAPLRASGGTAPAPVDGAAPLSPGGSAPAAADGSPFASPGRATRPGAVAASGPVPSAAPGAAPGAAVDAAAGAWEEGAGTGARPGSVPGGAANEGVGGQLARLLVARGLCVGPVLEAGEVPPEAAAGRDEDALAVALPALAMAAASLAPPGAPVDVVVDRGARAPSLSLHLPVARGGAEVPEPALLALARRRLAQSGGRLEVTRAAAGTTLVASFPAEVPALDAAG